MLLRTYLTDQKLSAAEFSRQIGVANPGVVAKYLTGERIPRPAIMKRIVLRTGGKVQPNDFFDIPADETPTDQASKA